MARAEQSAGEWLERKTFAALKARQTEGLGRAHRFYDTKSAGRYLPEQPADFLFGGHHKSHLIECKASLKYLSLSACLASHLSLGQAANLRLWSQLGTYCTWVIFCHRPSARFELWPGAYVGQCRAKGAVLNKDNAQVFNKINALIKGLLS